MKEKGVEYLLYVGPILYSMYDEYIHTYTYGTDIHTYVCIYI